MFASASGLTSGPNTALKRALRELSTAPAPGLVSHKKALATRSDEARGQQLRGIFAAFDEDRDGLLNEGELSSALLSLGIDPTHATLARYAKASPLGASAIDFASVSVCYGIFLLSLLFSVPLVGEVLAPFLSTDMLGLLPSSLILPCIRLTPSPNPRAF